MTENKVTDNHMVVYRVSLQLLHALIRQVVGPVIFLCGKKTTIAKRNEALLLRLIALEVEFLHIINYRLCLLKEDDEILPFCRL